MKNLRILLTTLVMLCAGNILIAQDLMILRSSRADTLKVKVIEIGTIEVKYKLWPVDEDMPVMVENKDRILKIILANGTIMRFDKSEFENQSNYADQKKQVIKIDFLSALFGTTSIAYEKSLEPGRSVEGGIGMIGLGFNKDVFGNRSGAFFRAGMKFIHTPDYYVRGMRYSHILKGAYIRPELVYNIFSYSTQYTTYSGSWPNGQYTLIDEKHRTSGFGLMINFGKQWVFSDMVALDIFGGIGVGGGKTKVISKTETPTNSYYYSDNYYESDMPYGTGFVYSTQSVSIMAQMGMKLGILF